MELFSVLFVVVLICLRSGRPRLTHDAVREFKASPRRFGGFPIGLSVAANIVGGGMFFLMLDAGARYPLIGLALGASYWIACLLLVYWMPRFQVALSDKKINSVFDFLERDLSAQGTPRWGVVIVFRGACLFLYTAVLGAQLIVLRDFTAIWRPVAFDTTALVGGVVAVVCVTYIAFGGLYRDIITDQRQSGLIFIGLLGLFAVRPELIGSAASHVLSGFAAGVDQATLPLILFLVSGPALWLRPDIWQRVSAVRDVKEGRRAFLLTGFLAFCAFVLFGALGGGLLEGDFASSGEFWTSVLATASPWLRIIVAAALFGAILSSVDTLLNVASVSGGELARKIGLPEKVSNYRYIVLVIAVFSLVLAFGAPGAVQLFAAGFGALIVFLPLVLSRVLGWKIHPPSMIVATYAGLALSLLSIGLKSQAGIFFALPTVLGVYLIYRLWRWFFPRRKTKNNVPATSDL